MIDAHVSEDSQTEFLNLLLVSRIQNVLHILLSYDSVEVLDGSSAQERLDSSITESDVYKGFQQVNQIYSVIVLQVLRVLRMTDEGFDHGLSTALLYDFLSAIILH